MSEIFIVGVGRSGTSLLQSMLNAHSGMTSIPEAQFFRKYVGNSKIRRRIEKGGALKFKELLTEDQAFQRLSIAPSSLKSLDHDGFSTLEVYKEVIQISKDRKNTSILVDKDPRNLEFMEEISKQIEGAKIIHIIRDPRDVVHSKTKAKWSANRPFWLHAMIGEAQLKKGAVMAKTIDENGYFKLQYEDLLKSPEEVLKRTCNFIDVPYEDRMLHFNESARELVSESEMQWKKETLQPLITTNVNKWKDNFSYFQVVLIETLSRWTMKNFEYVPYGNIKKLGLLDRIRIKGYQLAAQGFSLLYTILK
ncbi:MAG: sulfotransferase family protein [Flavobacteriaceae bacterium]